MSLYHWGKLGVYFTQPNEGHSVLTAFVGEQNDEMLLYTSLIDL